MFKFCSVDSKCNRQFCTGTSNQDHQRHPRQAPPNTVLDQMDPRREEQRWDSEQGVRAHQSYLMSTKMKLKF